MPVAAPRRRTAKKFIIGPEHDGRRMSLDDFDQWPVQDGYFYELGRGVVQVSNVPLLPHGVQVQNIRNQLGAYQMALPRKLAYILMGNDAKVLVGTLQSERHPDLLLYLSEPPEVSNAMWKTWIPEIVIEVVSPSSAKRDYEEKPQEYLDFGVREYWIVDAFKNRMSVLQRYSGQWKEKIIKPGQKYKTALLPKFTFDLKKVLAAAK